MLFFVLALLAAAVYVPLAGKNFMLYWKKGLIGVVIMIVVDSLGAKFNLYRYHDGFLIFGALPVFHIVQTYIYSLLFLNWLPRKWPRRLMYTACISVPFLAVEAASYSLGAIVYLNWKLWYSYFVVMAGLLLLAYLADLAAGTARRRPLV